MMPSGLSTYVAPIILLRKPPYKKRLEHRTNAQNHEGEQKLPSLYSSRSSLRRVLLAALVPCLMV